MTLSFNLIDKPWIPCLFRDGGEDQLGLFDVLTRAHEIQEIYDPSPLVVTALHRLFLAILHRSIRGPATLKEWKSYWQRGYWDGNSLSDYFNQWKDRFDLFDQTRPFYQVPKMKDAKEHPVQILAFEAAAGNNPTLFDHSFSMSPVALMPQQAARYLIARQAYSIGFGKSSPFYFKDSPLIRGYSILTLGNNLWETIALNLMAYNKRTSYPLVRGGLAHLGKGSSS